MIAAEMNSKTGFLIGLMASALLIAACTQTTLTPTPSPTPTLTPASNGMGMAGIDSSNSGQFAPLVRGFYQGGEVLFIHTEASDPQVASMLTMMMGPEVVLVPGLAESPGPVLAEVYVFTNGIEGMGPFGFQADVFDSVPGDQGYSPLRSVVLVTWNESMTARELRSVEDIKGAESRGEVTTERPGVVVNMPIMTWPGGRR